MPSASSFEFLKNVKTQVPAATFAQNLHRII